MNVVIYARYSSYSQTEQSIEGQLKVCREYAERNNYTIIGEYIDRALTGTNDNRPQFKKMISDSSKKLFEGILVYQLDRFARNRYDSAINKSKLKKNGVRVFSAKENISEDASGILMESVLEGMAEYYSAELSQKVKRGTRINAEKCLYNGGVIPLGYKINKEKKYEIDELTAPIVKKIFEMYCENSNIKEIEQYLKERDIKTFYNKNYNCDSIRRIIENKRYTGIYKYEDIEIEGGIPKIIEKDMFNKAQERLQKNKIAPARLKAKMEYLLSTKLFCGKCKEVMTGMSGTSSNLKTLYYYYSCNGKRKGICNKKNVQKDFIEDIVVNEAKKILTEEKIDKIVNEIKKVIDKEKQNSNIEFLEKKIEKLQKEKDNLMNSLKICDSDIVRKSIFEELEKVEKEKRVNESDLYEEKLKSNTDIDIMKIKFFLIGLKKGNINDIRYKRMLINVLVNKVYLYDDYIYIVFNVTDEKNYINIPLIEDIEKSSYLTTNGEPL